MNRQISFIKHLVQGDLLWIGYAALWIIFPLGQFIRYQLSEETPIYFVEIISAVIILLMILKIFPIIKKLYNPPFVAWIGFIIVLILSLILTPLSVDENNFALAFLYLARYFVASSLFLVGLVIDGRMKKRILKLMLMAGTGLAISGLVQYLVFPYFGPLANEGWDPHLFRIAASFFDPGFAGYIYASSLLMLIGLKSEFKLSKIAWSIMMGIFYLSLLLTYSRASYLAFIIGLAVIAFKMKAREWLIKVLVIFIFSTLLLPRPVGEGIRLERENSILARIENWSHAISIFKKYPVFGVGFNAYKFAQEREGYITSTDRNHSASGSDSSFLLVLATSGLVGGLAFCNLVFQIVKKLTRQTQKVGVVALASLFALLGHSWFLNSYFYLWILVWISTLIGLSINQSQEENASSS